MASKKAGDQKRQAGANAAALLGYLNCESGKGKREAFLQDRKPQEFEEQARRRGRTLLQAENQLFNEQFRNGNHQQEQKQREECGPKWP